MSGKFHISKWILTTLLVLSCKDTTTVIPTEKPVVVEEMGFSVLSQTVVATDTLIKIRVTWKAPNDPFGAPDSYRHTMTANKTVTDSSTGPFPNKKLVLGLADTVIIKLNLVNDSVTLTSNVWSVRRGIESTTASTAKLFVRRGDKPPLPPDSLKVDTLIVGFIWGGNGMTATTGPVAKKGIDPWVDTIEFARLYTGTPPSSVVSLPGDRVIPLQGDTTLVSSYRHPNVKFSIKPAGYVELASDSMSSIFRTITPGTVYIVAEYSKTPTIKIRDSLKVVAYNVPYCSPWPNCYYDPTTYAPKAPALPVGMNLADYVPLTCPTMVINFLANNKVDTSCVSRPNYCDC